MAKHRTSHPTTEAPALAEAEVFRAAVRDVKHDLKRAEPTYREVQDHCANVSGQEISCALDAKTTSAWEACLHHPDGGR